MEPVAAGREVVAQKVKPADVPAADGPLGPPAHAREGARGPRVHGPLLAVGNAGHDGIAGGPAAVLTGTLAPVPRPRRLASRRVVARPHGLVARAGVLRRRVPRHGAQDLRRVVAEGVDVVVVAARVCARESIVARGPL